MTKVAFLLNSLAGGGTERVTIALAHGLIDKGVDVTLLLVSKTGELLPTVDPRVRLHDFGKTRVVSCLWDIRNYLREHRPQVLFTALPPVNITGIVAGLLAHSGTAVVPVEHMPVSIDARENPGFAPKLAYMLYPFLYRLAARIVTISSDAYDDFTKTYPSLPKNKIALIHNPVEIERIQQAAREEPDDDWLRQATPDVPVLIGAGRLVKQKNFALLIRAFAQVRKDRPCRLIIFGTGYEQKMLESLIQESGLTADVRLAGFVANPYACMARARLFVLSSIFETLPTVLIEAQACGLPTVATPCFGVREVLGDGKFGIVVPDFTVEQLAKGIAAALTQTTDRGLLQAQAQRFSCERAVGQYMTLIEQFASGSSVQA